ncbi:MAG: YbjP/YqhG family protein [Novosphingobium sp.]|jgi:hypothetical protein|nr:YbjP/YqhG family protein [Novosphingobium sp.]
MTRYKTMILPAAALAMLASQAPAAPPPPQSIDAARAFLTRLYTGYGSRTYPNTLGPRARGVFTPRLVDLMNRDTKLARASGEVGIIEADPICDCQDPGGLKLKSLTVSPAGPAKARAQVTVRFDSEVRHLTFDLEDRGQGWRIADVHTKDTPSLVGLLEDGLRRQGAALPARR